MFSSIIIASLSIMAISLIGLLFIVNRFFKQIQKNINYLVSLSVGIFLVVAITDLIPKAISLSRGNSGPIFILVGFFAFFLLAGVLSEYHHHCEGNVCRNDHAQTSGLMVLFGDLGHNFVDGIIVAVAFTANPTLGIITTIGVLLHELPQEISEFFVLIKAGYSKTKAIFLNFLVSGTVLIGALLAYFFLSKIEGAVGPILGVTAGNLLYISAADLLPDIMHTELGESLKRKKFLLQYGLMLGGAILTILFF